MPGMVGAPGRELREEFVRSRQEAEAQLPTDQVYMFSSWDDGSGTNFSSNRAWMI